MFVFPGFNSNIDHRNKKYHVQTEVNTVNGVNKINTLIYFSGMIFASFSSDMTRDDAANRETAISAVRKQHNKIIRDLISDQLEPQQTVKDKDLIDFAGMYENDKIFSCHSKSSPGMRDTFRKLLVIQEEDA